MTFIDVFQSCHKPYRARRQNAIAKRKQRMINLPLSLIRPFCIVFLIEIAKAE